MSRKALPAPTVREAPPGTVGELQAAYGRVLGKGEISCHASYRVLTRIGEGRQGVVFRCLRQGAKDCEVERAIKVLNPAIYRTADEYSADMTRIANQITRLDGANSPHLVTRNIYEEVAGVGYVEMEAIDGIDVQRLLAGDHLLRARNRVSQDRLSAVAEPLFRRNGNTLVLQPGLVIHILEGILRGLERLHSMGFLHCDIKPSNVMIDRLGTVKIIDFGRAITVGETVTFLLGAPLYMAPETHSSRIVGTSTDLYSAGVVTLELLRGRPLAEGSDISEQSLLTAKNNLLDDLEPMLPGYVCRCPELMQLLQGLLHPCPEERYATARQAAVGRHGISMVERAFNQAGFYTDCSRDLADYLSLLVSPRTRHIEPTPPA